MVTRQGSANTAKEAFNFPETDLLEAAFWGHLSRSSHRKESLSQTRHCYHWVSLLTTRNIWLRYADNLCGVREKVNRRTAPDPGLLPRAVDLLGHPVNAIVEKRGDLSSEFGYVVVLRRLFLTLLLPSR